MATNDQEVSRRQRWEDRTRAPLLVGSAFFLLAYTVLILVPQLAAVWRVVVIVALSVVWAAYIVDLIVRVTLTPPRHRAEFIRTHPIDTASAFIPWVRPFQLLTYLRRIPWFGNASGDAIRSRVVVGALAYTILFIYVIALGVLAVERNAPDATIVTFGNAIWWACVTVATVGYGDFAPVTVAGRMLAVLLMSGGVAIIGIASATIVSYLSERIARIHSPHEPAQKDPPVTAAR
ncbi:potassium channel family protein [Cryobacterium sp. N22]|uniref:potassium channel family protein n=1 Tax=Cryobacterium sp. N22 TaxID=2048290 RepID=UPI000CE3D123|nr:potassium channel family protein [Cryobacterium sp. N22]